MVTHRNKLKNIILLLIIVHYLLKYKRIRGDLEKRHYKHNKACSVMDTKIKTY